MKNKPIRIQFLLVFLAFLILLFGLISLSNIFLLKPFYVWTKTEQLKSVSRHYDDVAVDPQNQEFLRLIEKTQYRDQAAVDVFDAEDELIYSSIRNSRENRPMDIRPMYSDEERGKLQDGRILVKQIYNPHHNQTLIVVSRLLPGGEILSLSSAMAAIEQSVAILNEFLLIVLLLFVILVWICARRFADYFSKPIVTLQQMTNRMIQFDFSQQWHESRRDELGNLGTNMNKLMLIIGNFIEELKGKNELLESELERKNKLDRMRKQFVSNVSHELKTPIALIQGYAEGLRVDVNTDSASREEYCDVIMDEARKMNELVRELLLLSQLELGQDALSIERFDIASGLRTAATRFRHLSANREIAFELNVQEDAAEVIGDRNKIDQVIANYLSNALYFVNEQKRIRIATVREGERIRVSVYNTGPHIPEDEMDQIWTSFYKVDKARTRGEGGTGLGLSIVKRIMDLHHMPFGAANVHDGVVFWFELPLAA